MQQTTTNMRLMAELDFSVDDLAKNTDGYISLHQRKKLLNTLVPGQMTLPFLRRCYKPNEIDATTVQYVEGFPKSTEQDRVIEVCGVQFGGQDQTVPELSAHHIYGIYYIDLPNLRYILSLRIIR